jgi:putative heme-binding domain-containing protein
VRRLYLIALVASTLFAQSPDTLAVGRKVFQGHCGLCHGQTGTGGKGPSLAQPTLVHAPDDIALTQVIENGIRGTEMPGSFGFTPAELTSLVAYIRSLGRTAVVKLPGDAARGKTIYQSKGACATCHIVGGEGGSLGPELSEIGASRTPEYLRNALLKPGADVPPAYLVVSVGTRDGKTIRGMRITEDTFTLQMRDSANRIYSFRKADLASYRKEFNQSLMPSFENRFTAAELDDLIAYLAGLRGGK